MILGKVKWMKELNKNFGKEKRARKSKKKLNSLKLTRNLNMKKNPTTAVLSNVKIPSTMMTPRSHNQ